MKKAFILFLTLLSLAAVSCQKEPDEPTPDVSGVQKDSLVTIRFGITAPEAVATKVMSDQPTITSLHVAVFGGSGYLKEYVLAEPVELATGERANENDTEHVYQYQVSLSLTKSRIRVHFIANGPNELPFDYESTVIGKLTTSGAQDAYWQRIILPHGIYALDDDGSRQTPPVYTVDPSFDLDENGNHMMASVPLIRNFAKITVVSEAANLTIKSFAVVNVPSAGTVAAFNTSTGDFVANYEHYSFENLSPVYPGNMPAGTTIEKIIPTVQDFTDGTNGVVLASSSDPNVYMYERPAPESNASFILLYATYTDDGRYSEGYDCFYKIDLMSDGVYLPIYRNFRYKLVIKSVYRPGMDTPTKAANGAGSGDISADTETASMENISDGLASIAVDFTELTYTDQGRYYVKFRYVPDITHPDVVQNGSDYVTFELLSPGASGNAIVENTLERADNNDSDTYRRLYFTTTDIGIVDKTQKIRIIGQSTVGGRSSRLYREVTVRLMPRQALSLSCSPSVVDEVKGEPLDLMIKIPKDLTASIFPLQFQIEAGAKSLTPNNDNLPVKSGISIINNGVPSYQFIKTLSREDYLTYQAAAISAGEALVSIPCHFKTNKAASASSIYVANPYFITAHTSFSNYIKRYFTQLNFTNEAAAADEAVDFKFMMDEIHDAGQKVFPNKVYVYLEGLIPSETNGNLSGTSNPFVYTVSANSDAAALLQTLRLQATGETVHYSVRLSATDYEDARLTANDQLAFTHTGLYSATNASASITDVPLGNRDVYFRFDYQTGFCGDAYPVTFTLSGLTPADPRMVSNGDGTYTYTPDDNLVSQYVHFRTPSRYGSTAANISISQQYYVSETVSAARATTFPIPAGALYARGYEDQDHPDVNPTKLGNRTVTLSADGNTSLANFTFTNYYNSAAQNVAIGSFTQSDDTPVYFSYTNSNKYTGTCTLGELFDIIEGTSSVVRLNLCYWATGSYSYSIKDHYGSASYPDSNSGITVSFTNYGYNRDGLINYRLEIGGDNAGTITISADNTSTLKILTSVTWTYFRSGLFSIKTWGTNYISADSGSVPGDNTTNTGSQTTWNPASTDPSSGTKRVVITMGTGNDPNVITNLTINYGYWDY